MLNIQVILGSTREGRKGEMVASWAMEQLKYIKGITFELIDLKEWNLPFLDEKESEIVTKWGEKVKEADGYIIITPEYNHGYPAPLKNALDSAYDEWNKKPVAFISYSIGIGAGIRAVEQLRQVAVELQMVPVRDALHIPSIGKTFQDGKPVDNVSGERLTKVIDSLVWWAEALKKARD